MLLPFLLLLLFVTVACASDSQDPNRVLELGALSITEEDFRADIRAAGRNWPADVGKLCNLSLFSEDEDAEADAVALAVELIAGNAAAITEPIPSDVDRAAEIIYEECDRRRNI